MLKKSHHPTPKKKLIWVAAGVRQGALASGASIGARQSILHRLSDAVFFLFTPPSHGSQRPALEARWNSNGASIMSRTIAENESSASPN